MLVFQLPTCDIKPSKDEFVGRNVYEKPCTLRSPCHTPTDTVSGSVLPPSMTT